MRQQISAYLNSAIFGILIAITVLTPLVFSPLTTEFFEIPKLTVLFVSILLLVVLWSLRWVVEGRVTITRTPLDLPLILLLVVLLLSTFLSDSRYISIFGNFPRVHGSVFSWVCYILLYFIAVSNLKGPNHLRVLLYTVLGSSVLVSIVAIMSYFSLYLPFSFAKTANFSPTGSSFATTSLLILVLPLLISCIVRPNKFLSPIIAIVLASLFGITIALVGDIASQIIALLAVGLVVFVTRTNKTHFKWVLIPVIVSLLVLIAGFIPLPKGANPLSQKRVDFPREIQLPIAASWKVSSYSFANAPFFGTGPSTYLFNFTQFKPADFNATTFWNIRFDTAYNEYLQVLGTLGGLGFLAFIFLSIMILGFGLKGFKYPDNGLVVGLSIAAIASIALMIINVTTPVSIVATFMVLALLMTLHKSGGGKVEELSLGIKASKVKDPITGSDLSFNNLIVGDILPIILFIPIFLAVLVLAYNGYFAIMADYQHRLALNSAQTNGIDTYNHLIAAENMNPRIDLYRIDLAQTNFALANAIASSKGPTEASPGGSLTDQDKTNIQTLLSQSINEGKVAVTISPRSAQNWEVLGSIYRQITGVAQNALSFSLDAYGRAIQNDPLNPLLRLNVGGIYYSVKNYDLAIRFFTDAANLKPDYANAYYNLSVALRDKGDLQNAQAVGEQVVSLLQKDTSSPDYKTASAYLADLKARIATGSAQQSQVTAPAAEENSALQNKELPKVQLDQLKDQPQNVATPPAVKKQQTQNP